MGAVNDTYANAHVAADGVANELYATLERARDERFRLIRLIKEVETRLASTPPPAPAEKIARLTDKVHNLDEALNQRFTRLNETDARIEKRLEQLDRMEKAIRELTISFGKQVQGAKQFNQDVAEAKRQVQLAADVVIDDSRQRLEQISEKLDEQLDREADQIARGFAQRLEQTAQQRIEACRSLFADREHQLCDALEQQFEDHEQKLHQQLDKAAAAATERFNGDRQQIIDQINRQHERLLGQLSKDLAGQQELAVTQITEHVNRIASAFGDQVNDMVSDANRRLDQATSDFAGQIEQRLVLARREVADALAVVEQALRERLGEIRDSSDSLVSLFEQQFAQRLESIPRQAADTVQQSDALLSRQLEQTRIQVERTIAPLRQQILNALQQAQTGTRAARADAQSSPVLGENLQHWLKSLGENASATERPAEPGQREAA